MSKTGLRWCVWGTVALGVVCSTTWIALSGRPMIAALWESEPDAARPAHPNPTSQVMPVRVETVKPTPGGMERTTTQIGSVYAFESAQLFAKVSGYLKSQVVDIGDFVQRDQVLAEIDVPELLKEVEQAKAALEQAKAQVTQADARVATEQANQEAAVAAVKKAEADVEHTSAARRFREKQHQRIKSLFERQSIEERLVDEKLDELEAAIGAEHAATAAVTSAKAAVNAAIARVDQAKADAAEARAAVDVAAAALAKAEVLAAYTKIVSPYDGVVTKRNFFRGDFIRAADAGGQVPLLAVDRTDKMRVVVQVPDRDASLTKPGNDAVIEIDALPGVTFSGKVARIANAEDSETRTMRSEIDLENRDNMLRQGMYGLATIRLGAAAKAIRIPSSSLVGEVNGGKGAVYVAEGGIAHLARVQVGADDGVQMEILHGITPHSEVIYHHTGALAEGMSVQQTSAQDAQTNPEPPS